MTMQSLNPEVFAAICLALWHHQGGSSPVGQPLRPMLGLGQHDRMTPDQIEAAKRLHKLFHSENDMSTKNDPYASEEDTRALLSRDKRTNAEKQLEAMLEDRFANEQGVELEGRFNILRQIALELLEPKSYRFPAESAKFKAWYDAWWLGDGFQAESIPGYEEPDFPKYLNGYTLAFGAWMAAKHDANVKG